MRLTAIHWEDSTCNSLGSMGLCEWFMWLLDDDNLSVALAVVECDPERHHDGVVRWSITDGAEGVSGTYDDAKRKVEAALGLPVMPVRKRSSI